MNPKLFDQISRRSSETRLSRRGAVGASLAAVTGTRLAAAQDATRVATPEVDASLPVESTPTQLFVQSFQSGSIAPSTSAFGTHTVTLAQGMGQTIVFTDRSDLRRRVHNPKMALIPGWH